MLSSGNCLVLILVESLISWNVHYSPWIVNSYLKQRVHAIFLRWKGFKRQNLKQLPSFHWTSGVNKWIWLNMNCSRMAIITNSMNKSWRGCGENRTILHCWCWYSHYGKQYGDSSENQKQTYQMTQQFYSWACMQIKLIQGETRTSMFMAALSQQPRHGNNLNAPWKMKGQRKRGVSTHDLALRTQDGYDQAVEYY